MSAQSPQVERFGAVQSLQSKSFYKKTEVSKLYKHNYKLATANQSRSHLQKVTSWNSNHSIYLEHLRWQSCILPRKHWLSTLNWATRPWCILKGLQLPIFLDFAPKLTTVLTPVMIFRASLLHSFMGAAVANLCAVPRISALLTWRQILSTATTPDQIWCRHTKDVWSNLKEHHILGALGSLPSATKPKHQNVNVLDCKKKLSSSERPPLHTLLTSFLT